MKERFGDCNSGKLEIYMAFHYGNFPVVGI